MNRIAVSTCAALLLAFASAQAQPDLASLWPNDDGMRWDYEYHLINLITGVDHTTTAFMHLSGTVNTPGGMAQTLVCEHGEVPAAGSSVPGLPEVVLMALDAGRDTAWLPRLLHGGSFLKSASGIQMWQAEYDHATWSYLTDNLNVGATFTWQLVPELASDIYLTGSVTSTSASIETPVGTFTNAVKVEYTVDLGYQPVVDEQGHEIGRVHGLIRGRVHYVPDLGPVEMYEEYEPYDWFECSSCPPEWITFEGVAVQKHTLVLTTIPSETAAAAWGGVKAMYR